MSLFDPEFYPTPKEIAIRMAVPYAERLQTARILEPSAGNGAILEAITSSIPFTHTSKDGRKYTLEAKADRKRIYAIEKDPELKLILQQKGYRLLADDFLTYVPDHHFDLIIMNPPFSHGDRHLLHAWEVLHHGDIACLLNTETIRNPYTATRQRLAALIAEHGNVEQLGAAFKHADNTTDVDVVLVRLHKERPADSQFSLNGGTFTKENTPDFGTLAAGSSQVEVSRGLDAYLRAWAMTKEKAADFIRAFQQLRLYADAFLKQTEEENRYAFHDNSQNIYVLLLKDLLGRNDENTAEQAYDHFIDEAKHTAWNRIISEMGLEKYMTGAMQETMRTFRAAQASAELNKANIMQLFQMLMASIGNIMDRCVSDVYDLFTNYYDGNTSCEEGWKTNKRYKANRKVIIPCCAEAGFMPQKYGYDKFFTTNYLRRLEDIDKAMCWLTGQNYEKLDDKPCQNITGPGPEQARTMTIDATIRSIRVGDQDWHESAFFRVKAFKKGTVHLEFKDEALWAKFNQTVNKDKNQLASDNSQ